MNDIKFDILNKPKEAQSELDRIMQAHVDSGQFSKEQLAEMRKAEANKLKEAKATKIANEKAAKEAEARSKEEEEKTEEPKKSLLGNLGAMYTTGSATSAGSAFTAKQSLDVVNKELEEEESIVKAAQPKKKKKSYIPNADELEEMTDDSVFFVEKNLTQNLNKHFNEIGERRYTVVDKKPLRILMMKR